MNRWVRDDGQQSVTTPGTVLDGRRRADDRWRLADEDAAQQTDPADLSVEDAVAYAATLSPGELCGFCEAEKAGRNRPELIEALDRLIPPPGTTAPGGRAPDLTTVKVAV